jgi:hypothetical protein
MAERSGLASCLTTTVVADVQEMIARRVDAAGTAWLHRGCVAAADTVTSADAFLEVFATAARRLGRAAVQPSADESARLRAVGVTWPTAGWGLDEMVRALLLMLAARSLPVDRLDHIVEECYRTGDNRERHAVLRALPFLPGSERILAVGVEACRSSVQSVFESIACENPFPAARFPDLNFNQMVLKVLFTDVRLERVLGLDARVTPELRRMAAGYASERRAAGRSLPIDIGRLIDPTEDSAP